MQVYPQCMNGLPLPHQGGEELIPEMLWQSLVESTERSGKWLCLLVWAVAGTRTFLSCAEPLTILCHAFYLLCLAQLTQLENKIVTGPLTVQTANIWGMVSSILQMCRRSEHINP